MIRVLLQYALRVSQEITFFKGAITKELKRASRQWCCIENYSIKQLGGFLQNGKKLEEKRSDRK